MSFGKMNDFASIIKRTISKDSEGFKAESEEVLAGVRCYHEQRHSSYRWANLAAFSQATDRFVMRKSPHFYVEVGFFIDCNNVRYKILSVENVKERNMYIDIYAERAVPVLG
jgi:hypothetical protein